MWTTNVIFRPRSAAYLGLLDIYWLNVCAIIYDDVKKFVFHSLLLVSINYTDNNVFVEEFQYRGISFGRPAACRYIRYMGEKKTFTRNAAIFLRTYSQDRVRIIGIMLVIIARESYSLIVLLHHAVLCIAIMFIWNTQVANT